MSILARQFADSFTTTRGNSTAQSGDAGPGPASSNMPTTAPAVKADVTPATASVSGSIDQLKAWWNKLSSVEKIGLVLGVIGLWKWKG